MPVDKFALGFSKFINDAKQAHDVRNKNAQTWRALLVNAPEYFQKQVFAEFPQLRAWLKVEAEEDALVFTLLRPEECRVRSDTPKGPTYTDGMMRGAALRLVLNHDAEVESYFCPYQHVSRPNDGSPRPWTRFETNGEPHAPLSLIAAEQPEQIFQLLLKFLDVAAASGPAAWSRPDAMK